MNYVACVVAGYLIGGIPFGILLSKIVKGVDPRATGSGSSGATNVSRVLGKGWGFVVLLLDASKGFLPVIFLTPVICGQNLLLGGLLIGVSAMIGHIWTPYAGFRGGKGVATAAGVLAAVSLSSLLIAFGCWVLVFAITRIVSAASITSAIAFPAASAMQGKAAQVVIAGILISLLIIFTHRGNIQRLRSGQEKKLF